MSSLIHMNKSIFQSIFHDTSRKFLGKILTDYMDYGKTQLFQRQKATSYVTKIDLVNPFGDGQSK